MRLVIKQNGVLVPFSNLNGECVVELTDIYLDTAELNVDGDLLLTMNDATTHLVPLSSIYTTDLRLPVVVVAATVDVLAMQVNEVSTVGGAVPVDFFVPDTALFAEGEIIIFRRNGPNVLNLKGAGFTTINGINTFPINEDYRTVWFSRRGNDWTAIADYDESDTDTLPIFTLEANESLWGANTAVIPGNARGQYAVDVQGHRATAFQVASGNGAVAVGNRVEAPGNQSVGIGDQAVATGLNSIGLGGSSFSQADDGIAIGSGAQVISAAHRSIAIGSGARATGGTVDAIVLGTNAESYEDGSVVIGANAYGGGSSPSSTTSVAIGRNASVPPNSPGGIAIGDGANLVSTPYVNSPGRIAIGEGATTGLGADGAIAIGDGANASSPGSIVVGTSTISSGQSGGISVGHGLSSSGGGYNGDGNILIGATLNTGAGTEESVLMGRNIGIGTGSPETIAILGSVGNSSGTSICLGGSSVGNNSPASIVIGEAGTVTAPSSASIGAGTSVASSQSVSLGHQSSVQSDSASSIAIGNSAVVQQYSPSSIAIGDTANIGTSSQNGIAIGNGAGLANNAPGGISIGNATIPSGQNGEILIGNSISSVGGSYYGYANVGIGQSITLAANTDSCVAIGRFVSIGNGSAYSTAINNSAIGASSGFSVGIGVGSSVGASSPRSISIGRNATVSQNSEDSFASGYQASVGITSPSGIAIGKGATVNNTSANSVTIGPYASASGGNSVSIGPGVSSAANQASFGHSNAPTDKIVLDNGQLTIPALDVNGHITEQVTTVSTGSNYVINMAIGTVWAITLTASITISFSNVVAGRSCTVNLIQGGGGSNIVTWTGVSFPGGTAPTLSTTVGRRDKIVFDSYNGAVIDGSLAGLHYS